MGIVPDAGVAVGDAAALLDGGRFDEHDPRAALRELAQVHEVPVGDRAVERRVLAHRRDDDAVPRLDLTNRNFLEEKGGQSRNTPLPVVWVSKLRYASAHCSSFQRCEKMRSRGILWSAMKRAHSSMPIALKVQEPISVTCRRSRSGLTSRVTSPPSPTKQAVPQVFTQRTAAWRADAALLHSSERSTPAPFVFSRMFFKTSSREASTTSLAPNCFASAMRSGLVSTAMTRAPIALPRMVADRPTGPWPKTASVSPPASFIRLSAE